MHAAPIPAALRRSVLNAPGSGLDTLQGQQDQASKLDPRVNLGEVIDMAKILDSAGANVDASAAKASSELAAGDAAEMLPKQTGRRTSRRVSKPKYTAEVEFMNRPNIPGPQKTGPRPKGQEFTAEQKRANSLATRRRYYWNTVRPKLVLTRSEDKREANRYRESQRLASIRHSEKKVRAPSERMRSRSDGSTDAPRPLSSTDASVAERHRRSY